MRQLSNIQKTMSSREIADLTGKEHRSVLRDIDVLNVNYEKLGMHKVVPTSYQDSFNRQQRQYELTKMQTIDLMTGYNIELRIKINRRWEELENQSKFQVPSTIAEALRLAANQAEQIEHQQKQIEEQKPKVLFADAVATSKTSILVGELAKLIKQNGYDIGQNRLFDWLRTNGYLINRKGTDYNMPTQRSMDLGLFEIKENTIAHSDGHTSIIKTPKVTGKGQLYFVNKFLNILNNAA